LDDSIFFRSVPHLYLGNNNQPKQQCRVIITGALGAGKTALATHFIHQVQKEHADHSLFWINARDKEEVKRLNWVFPSNWLMVFDGVLPLVLHDMKLSGWLPGGLKGTLLFTTTDKNCAKLVGPVKVIEVPVLTPEEQQLILSKASIKQTGHISIGDEESEQPKLDPRIRDLKQPQLQMQLATLYTHFDSIKSTCSPYLQVEAANPHDLTFFKISQEVSGYALQLSYWVQVINSDLISSDPKFPHRRRRGYKSGVTAPIGRAEGAQATMADFAGKTLDRLLHQATELGEACVEARPRHLKLEPLPHVDENDGYDVGETEDEEAR
jgi:hypothetical protein